VYDKLDCLAARQTILYTVGLTVQVVNLYDVVANRTSRTPTLSTNSEVVCLDGEINQFIV